MNFIGDLVLVASLLASMAMCAPTLEHRENDAVVSVGGPISGQPCLVIAANDDTYYLVDNSRDVPDLSDNALDVIIQADVPEVVIPDMSDEAVLDMPDNSNDMSSNAQGGGRSTSGLISIGDVTVKDIVKDISIDGILHRRPHPPP